MTESKRSCEHRPAATANSKPSPGGRPLRSAVPDAGTTPAEPPQRKPPAAARTGPLREPEDQIVSKYLADTLNRALDAAIGRLTFGIAPVASAMDVLDWLGHMAVSPGKQARLFEKAVRKAGRFWWYAARSLGNPDTRPAVEPLPHDRRFVYEEWRRWPFNWMHQSFLLTSGRHNVGIVNEPGHPGRSYRMRTSHAGERTIDPDTWLARTPQQEGSWWPAWAQWLAERSSEQAPPPPIGATEQGYHPLEDAPATYVFEK